MYILYMFGTRKKIYLLRYIYIINFIVCNKLLFFKSSFVQKKKNLFIK